ncbi:Rv3654c family TadE-like protein [Microbacterium sp.]|uniref:Rv3654c family TadE-like protein n=1 Tax=Microbacterium sp. TaxID=51671 RepID=UPI00289FA711|nr:Rv3654c family TadE-like protein [Microbacterium sp.]
MAGTALGVGALAVTAALAVGCGAVGAASVLAARASGAADAAALAAADAAAGAVTGVPCERARQVATAAGADLLQCDLDATTATVRVQIGGGLLAAQARARAGPAP